MFASRNGSGAMIRPSISRRVSSDLNGPPPNEYRGPLAARRRPSAAARLTEPNALQAQHWASIAIIGAPARDPERARESHVPPSTNELALALSSSRLADCRRVC